jgi:hypothetical protein
LAFAAFKPDEFMDNLDPYLDKFSESGRRVLVGALNESRRREQNFISPAHILSALINEEPELFESAMRGLSIEPDEVRRATEKRLENSRRHAGQGIRIAPETTDIFRYSMERARSYGRRVIDAADLLHSMSRDKESLLGDSGGEQAYSFHNRAFDPNPSSQEIEPGFEDFHSRTEFSGSEFLRQFSLRELIARNKPASRSLLLEKVGGFSVGTGLRQVGWEKVDKSSSVKQKSVVCQIKPEFADSFDEAEFVSSIAGDIEENLNQNRFAVTRNSGGKASRLRIEYEKGKTRGEIDLSGQMKSGYYELQAVVTEKINRKLK